MISEYYVYKTSAEWDGKGTHLTLNSCWRGRKIYLPVYQLFGDWKMGWRLHITGMWINRGGGLWTSSPTPHHRFALKYIAAFILLIFYLKNLEPVVKSRGSETWLSGVTFGTAAWSIWVTLGKLVTFLCKSFLICSLGVIIFFVS